MVGCCTPLALGHLYYKWRDFVDLKNEIVNYKRTDAYKRIQNRKEHLVEYVLSMGDKELDIDYVKLELKRSPLADDSAEEHRQLMVRC
jgi:hypothetical protein